MPVRPALRHALVLPVAALIGSALIATPASAAEPAATTLTVTPYRVSKIVGQGVTFSWTLTSGSTKLAGKTVEVYTRPTTTTTWTKHSTRTMNSGGATSIAFTVKRSTYVLAKFLGTTAYAPSKSGGGLVTATQPFGTRVVNEAYTHRGKPYQWGAVGPTRFDCSGFTLYVFQRFGKSLPHSSRQQYASVRHIARADKKIGDLIFTYNSGGIYHVGIYAGNGEIWHAPHSGDVVKRSAMWSSSYYVGRVA